MQQQYDVENKVKYSRNDLIIHAATEVNFKGVMCVTRRNGSNKCSGEAGVWQLPLCTKVTAIPSDDRGYSRDAKPTPMQGVPILPQ